eukprot:694637-Prymnesium_polylepis.1
MGGLQRTELIFCRARGAVRARQASRVSSAAGHPPHGRGDGGDHCHGKENRHGGHVNGAGDERKGGGHGTGTDWEAGFAGSGSGQGPPGGGVRV